MSNGDVNAAIYLHQVTGDLEPVIRAAMSSGTLTDQMVRLVVLTDRKIALTEPDKEFTQPCDLFMPLFKSS